jgi:hypothetical protein
LKGYSEMLDSLESHYLVGRQHVFDMSLGPEIREQYEQACYSLYRFINGFVQDLATLEERNPELRVGELVARRQRLNARQRKIEQRAKEQGVVVGPLHTRDLGSEAFPTQPAEERRRRRADRREAREQERGRRLDNSESHEKPGRERGTSAGTTPALHGYRVGDTAITEAGDTLTVHSYEIPIPSPYRDEEAKAGYEYSVIDVEVCSNAESEERINTISRDDFALQMPDNTRRQSLATGKERALPYSVLLPGDPLRGLVFFQTPQDEKLIAIIYTGRNRKKAKWII